MIFTYTHWKNFCESLKNKNIISVPACEVRENSDFLVLKHDVETNVKKAYKMAKIESGCGHRGSYYVQAYLIKDKKNVLRLKKMQDMGHEISYHYDVMDSNKGNIENAIREFKETAEQFKKLGFVIKTVCQHGNPVVERIGYTSNRDFFRNEKVQSVFPDIADIMVDYPQKYNVGYNYYSDAGRKFNLIYDPFNNDIIDSEDKNIPYPDLKALFKEIEKGNASIISTHPHRWTQTAFIYTVKTALFKSVRFLAKKASKIPLFKRIMSRYYYLAKKI